MWTVWLIGRGFCSVFFFFPFFLSIALSLGEEELEASVSLAWWPCSQGYHLNNTGSLMTVRPRAVTVRLLSVCPVAAGDVGVC